MSRGLPGPVRDYLDAIDPRLESMDHDDKKALAEQALATMQLYQGLSTVALARVIMESVVAMDGCLARASRPDGDLEKEVRGAMLNAATLAALLTRQARGRPPL